MRFTFSKRGVSTSWGTKHFRFTAGPRGTYVTSHFGGFYYRARVDTPPRRTTPETSPLEPHATPRESDDGPTTHYSVGDLPRLTDTTQADFVRELNGATSPRWRMQVIAAAISAIAFIAFAGLNSHSFRPIEVLMYALILVGWARHHDNRRRRYVLMFDLDRSAEERWTRMRDAVVEVGRSGYVQSVRSEHHHGDRRRHGGATAGVTSQRAHISCNLPRFVLSNVVPVEIVSHDAIYYLFPDRLLVRSGASGAFAASSYSSLTIDEVSVAFTWDTSPPPRDAEVLRETWLYVRNDGGPDRRFNNNVKLPVLAFGELRIRAAMGLGFVLLASRPAAVRAAVEALESYGRASSDVAPESPSATYDPEVRAALAVFGQKVVPPVDELKRLYRELATRNHPDRFANAAPAIRLMATSRMQEINQAYRLLFDKAPSSAPEAPAVEPADDASASIDAAILAPEKNRSWIVALSVACGFFVCMRVTPQVDLQSLAPSETPATAQPNISVSLLGMPDGARVRIDGQQASEAISLPRDNASHRVEIFAPGYRPYSLTFVADRDVALAVSLVRDTKERSTRRHQKPTAGEAVDVASPSVSQAGSSETSDAPTTAHATADAPKVATEPSSADPWAAETAREPAPSTDESSGPRAKETAHSKQKDDPKWRDPFDEPAKEKAKPPTWNDPFAE